MTPVLGLVPLVLLVVLVLFTIAGVRDLRLAIVGRPRAGHRCYACRYDLRGRPAEAIRCPECGAPIVEPGRRPPLPARARVWIAACGLVLVLPGLTAGHWGWRLAQFTDVYQRIFAISVLRRTAADPEHRRFADSAIAAVLESYASGGSSRKKLQLAVDVAVSSLVDGPVVISGDRDADDAGLMRSQTSSPWMTAASMAMDSPEYDAARRAEILDAFLDAYRRRPVDQSSEIDDLFVSLLSGRRAESEAPPAGEPAARFVEQRERARELFLDLQADRGRAWNDAWGAAFVRAWNRGGLTPEQFGRFLRQSLDPVVRVVSGTPPLSGDVIKVELRPRWRGAPGVPVSLRLAARGPAWEGRVLGPITDWYQGTGSGVSNDSRLRALLLLPDTPGPVVATFNVECVFGGTVEEEESDADEAEGAARAIPPLRFLIPVDLPLELEASALPRVRLAGAQDPPAEAALRIDPDSDLQYAEGEDGRAEFLLTVWPGVVKRDVALDAFIRQDGVEHAIGWTYRRRIDDRPMRWRGTLPAIDPGRPVDVILRASVGLLERPAMSPVVWSGEVERPGIRPFKRARPGLLGQRGDE